jgi:hypothetical protein
MTVRADDIAFRDFVQYSRRTRPSDHARDRGAFRARICLPAPLLTLALEIS